MSKLRTFFQYISAGLAGAILMPSLLVFLAWYYYQAPGPLSAPITLIFKKGEGFQAIVDDMAEQDVIRHPWIFKMIAVSLGDARRFNAGEYEFTAAISPRLVMDMIAEGRVVVHKLTIPEGFTVRETVQMLRAEKALDGEVDEQIAEGSLLPETYHFTYGERREELIKRMQAGMTAMVTELWANRQKNLPFETPDQAVTLASVIERETAMDSERKKIAAVFVNRLRKGMKLQSDPTVIYGIEQAQHAKMERPLTSNDLRGDTPYNTYVIPGLPPTPISNPGRASIDAVLHPANTNDLFFVATGSGGHNFSTSLKEHNEYVQQYRENVGKKDKDTPKKGKEKEAKKESPKKEESKSAAEKPKAE